MTNSGFHGQADTGDFIIILLSMNISMKRSPRLLRGGSFDYLPAFVRSANRYWYAPSYRSASFGFRPARTYP